MAKPPVFRTPYLDDYVDKGLQCVDDHGEPEKSLAVQSEKDACDINLIVDKYAKTGILPVMSQSPTFGDVSNAPSFQEALEIVKNAENAFNSLDARVRREFDNDPAKFLSFVDNPENADRLVTMGLREAPKSEPPLEPIKSE